ncbi:hypothetical protein OURE66S_03479 [Oligella ureolytica]
MSKNSEAVYKNYGALAAESVKGGVESCGGVVEIIRYLQIGT